MKKTVSSFLSSHYESIVIGLICLYFLCALEVVTMVHYLPLIPKLVKAIRYLIYAAFVFMFLFHFFHSEEDESSGNWKDHLHALGLFFLNRGLLSGYLVLSILIYLTSGSLIPFAIGLMALCADQISLKKLMKWIFYTQLAAFVLIILASKIGILADLTYPTYRRGVRHSLGYIFPLELHAHFFFLSLLYLWLFRKQKGWISFLVISVLNFALYHFSISRTSFYLTEAAAVLALLLWLIPEKRQRQMLDWKGWKNTVVWGTGLVFVSFFAACLLYNPEVEGWMRLNDWLSGRLELGQAALMAYPVTPFGQQITWIGSGGPAAVYVWEGAYNYVDNSYIKDFLDYGLIFWLFEYTGFVWIQLTFIRKKNLLGLCSVWLVFLLAMMEPRLISLPYNVFLLFLLKPLCARNREAEAWFKNTFPIRAFWSRRKTWQKGVLAGAAAAAAVAGFAGLHQGQISRARREYASGLLSHRSSYSKELLELETPQNSDSVEYRTAILEAIMDTDGYQRKVYEIQPSDSDTLYEITDEELDYISDLKEQKTEREFREILEADLPGEGQLSVILDGQE